MIYMKDEKKSFDLISDRNSFRMFPQLTDDQVKEYQTRMATSAAAAGWKQEALPHPVCHLLFHR